jgi:hypothetical protein
MHTILAYFQQTMRLSIHEHQGAKCRADNS